MDWVLIGAMAFAAWSAVSVLGAERQRLIDRRAAEAEAAALAVAAPTGEAAAH